MKISKRTRNVGWSEDYKTVFSACKDMFSINPQTGKIDMKSDKEYWINMVDVMIRYSRETGKTQTETNKSFIIPFNIEINKIYNEDCLIGMKRIPNKSIDMICCDLPYGVLNKGNKSAKWDNIIPFDELWKQYERIIKDDGVIVLFGQGLFTAKLIMSNEKWYRYSLIWEKDRPTGFLNSKRMPLRNHEDIMVFYKKLGTYNPQMIYAPHKRNHTVGKGGKKETNRCYGKLLKVKKSFLSDYKYPRSIIEFKKEHFCNGDEHPTQKPVKLIEWLIKTYSNERDIVLDNCMGSGTTAVACINTNRNFIGFELDKGYYDMAQKRLVNIKNKLHG